MKKPFIILFFLSNSLLVFGQIDSLSEKEAVAKLCSGKWYIEYVGIDDYKVYHEEFIDWLNFYLDGTMDVSVEDDFIKTEYSYNHIKKSIKYREGKETTTWTIDKLNDEELTLKQTLKDKVTLKVCNKTARMQVEDK
jgi:hypothetical protein